MDERNELREAETEPEETAGPAAQARDGADDSGQPVRRAAGKNGPAGPEEETQTGFGTELYFWLQALVLALVSVILCFTLVGRLIGVDGTSMLNTLHDRDMMIVRSIGYEPKAGDVVVLTKKSFMAQPIVKRVIAVAGQHVEIDYDAGTVTVDGQVLDEPYIAERMTEPYWDNIKSVDVPENCIFVMGDNRNASGDSRAPALGVVDTRYVIGEVLCVIFPFSHIAVIS
ncbi:MAG TPA: signal peptidase I [Oscillospiraceae bacterium]|nr:signal peptidase I [Oscillospiraceae bacterium]